MIRTGFINGKLIAIRKQYLFETLTKFHKNKTIITKDLEGKSINILHLATSEVFLIKFIDEVKQKKLSEGISLLFKLNHRLYLVSKDDNEQYTIKHVFIKNKQLHIWNPNNQSKMVEATLLDNINSTVKKIAPNI